MSIAKAYNDWSGSYDEVENKTRDLDQLATRQTLAPYTFGHILEMGCGTGKNTAWLLQKAAQVTAFDFSEGMLARARKKIRSEKVLFRQADLTQEWPVDEGSADLITFNLILEHIAGLDHIFREAAVALRSGGKLFISELHPFKQYTGSKARFDTDDGVQELEVYTHHVSEFTGLAQKHGFSLLSLQEWWSGGEEQEVPRLLTLLWERRPHS